MMNSMSARDAHRRREGVSRQPRGKPLARSNSSFLGVVKGFLNKFTGSVSTVDATSFAEEADSAGKRRRAGDSTSLSEGPSSDGPAPKKRQRMASPEPQQQQMQHAYLDPPPTAFANSIKEHSHSPSRGLSRNMSIDPPAPPRSRDISMKSIISNNDSSLDSARDHSMPPLTRSFRIRSSLTPQPQPHREFSEPPSLTTLINNPQFIHPPAPLSRKLSVSSSSTTLGSLAESRRSTLSPVRQHSLLFGIPEKTVPTRLAVTPENSLEDLEIYKTPLIPTRLRTTSSYFAPESASAVGIDQFRHKSKLIPDSVRNKKSKSKGKDKQVNKAKPYAGEGGMKKFLARVKKDSEQAESEKDEASPAPASQVVPPLPKEDWTKLANPAGPQRPTESSLRVGRTLTGRNHTGVKAKFSASFEDEEEDEETKLRARIDLEEAAKKVPEFNIGAGFTFANTNPVQPIVNGKEPPRSSLPFAVHTQPAVTATTTPPLASALPILEVPKAAPASVFAPPAAVPSIEAKQPARASTGIPNFFSNASPVVAPSVPSLSLFAATPAKPESQPSNSDTQSTFSFPASTVLPSVSTPIKDPENPFWDGDKKKDTSKPNFFNLEKGKENISTGGESSNSSPPSAAANGFSLFNAPKKDGDKGLFSPFNPSEAAPVSTSTFFGTKPTTVPAPTFSLPPPHESTEKSSTLFGNATIAAPASTSTGLFSLGKAETTGDAPQSSSLFGTGSKPAESTTSFKPFGAIQAPTPVFGSSEPSKMSSDPSKSMFSAPSEAPKPFGSGISGFPLTPPVEQPKGGMFGFGNPSTSEPKPAPFSFGQSSSSSNTATTFNFGSSTASADKFAFGASTSRPVTPPRNESQEFSMDESPTREIVRSSEPRPSLGAFGSSSFGSSFGQSGGGFGSSSGFGGESKPEASSSKPFGSGFPTSDTAPTFGFPKPQQEDPARPSTSNPPFFSQPANSNPFAFGTSAVPSTPFSQSQVASAPSSPSTFSSQQGFPFGAPAPAANPFGAPAQSSGFGGGFGSSQPASPATSVSGLPSASSFTFNTGGQTAPTFGAATPAFSSSSTPTSFGAPAAPATPGGSLFNMGAVPAAAGSRPVKKLPNRRGGVKR